MSDLTSPVRVFGTADVHGRTSQFGDRRIFVTPAVEHAEGGPMSVYSAHFGRGEHAELAASYEEVWTVTRGRLRISSADAVVTVGAGQFVHIPRKSPGEVEALEDASLVCVSVPAH